MELRITDNLEKIEHEFDLKGRMGSTDYIDFLFPNEVPYNKVKGKDIYDRNFIILKVGIYDLKKFKLRRIGQVFFQRYSNTDLSYSFYFYNWQGASLDGEFIGTGGGINQNQIKLISDIVDNKLVKLEDYHKPYNFRSGDYKLIASMDYWEDRAARIIQKQFIKCRYEPKYTICKNILKRQFDEYLKGL